MIDPFALASFATGMASSFLGAQDKKSAASKAAAEAKRAREWHELQARETKQTLGREIESMRTLRDLDLPAYQQAAQVSAMMQRKSYEQQTRTQQLGKLPQQYREAVFGGQLQQYIGREGQKIQRYAQMQQGIFDMASKAQSEVNQMLKAGGAEYGSMMRASQAMDYEAGDPLAGALGSISQGLSLLDYGGDEETDKKKKPSTDASDLRGAHEELDSGDINTVSPIAQWWRGGKASPPGEPVPEGPRSFMSSRWLRPFKF